MASQSTWSEEELRAPVAIYGEMYPAEQEGREINYAKMYRELEPKFGRRDMAFERHVI